MLTSRLIITSRNLDRLWLATEDMDKMENYLVAKCVEQFAKVQGLLAQNKEQQELLELLLCSSLTQKEGLLTGTGHVLVYVGWKCALL